MKKQLSLDVESSDVSVKEFSHDGIFKDIVRKELEEKYRYKLVESDELNRTLVSFQGNKKTSMHNWFKYREGFSAQLVESLLKEFKLKNNATVLDPFSGSGTTALTANFLGFKSIGIDILPVAKLTYEVKKNILEYDVPELKCFLKDIKNATISVDKENFEYLTITDGAFSKNNEEELIFLRKYIIDSKYSELSKELLLFVLMSILEEISFTRKDGQYLRWDYRSEKVKSSNKKREDMGRPPLKTKLDKGEIPTTKKTFMDVFETIVKEIEWAQNTQQTTTSKDSSRFYEGSALFELPKLDNNTISAVVTSPPYANRYDYTRTYALELNFLGLNNKGIKELRQNLLSATVENKSKIDELKTFYSELGFSERFNNFMQVYENNLTLKEILESLKGRALRGEVNNKGIIRMIEGYFLELTFIYGELFRLSKSGSHVAVVNDNVRYAGEIIPVDFISCEIAEALGFKVDKIYTLRQKKGNSSQQMKKYGRVALRKSVTVWKKV
ncbi:MULTISPECIES: DNA methyltransferase [Lactococcus]|uniref:DNA methyltransferase n=1 Tax=Lactococcus TaxID=1357 RepID=UPI0013FD71C4|nr:DNA methyltransferase [Lactococcus petauri]NHI78273.1 modification methylase [Lactococcus petauri]